MTSQDIGIIIMAIVVPGMLVWQFVMAEKFEHWGE